MQSGAKRILLSRICAALGVVCGSMGLFAGVMNHTWKLWPMGWFTGGTLLTLVALFMLLDGAIAAQRAH